MQTTQIFLSLNLTDEEKRKGENHLTQYLVELWNELLPTLSYCQDVEYVWNTFGFQLDYICNQL